MMVCASILPCSYSFLKVAFKTFTDGSLHLFAGHGACFQQRLSEMLNDSPVHPVLNKISCFGFEITPDVPYFVF